MNVEYLRELERTSFEDEEKVNSYSYRFYPSPSPSIIQGFNGLLGTLDTIININEVDTKTKVKSKKAFYTFDIQGRKVTIAAVTRGGSSVSIGYSVCMVEDIKFNEDGSFNDKISRLTATGRAIKKPLGSSYMEAELTRNHGMLKSLAMFWASKVQKGDIVIKGIKPLTKKEKKILSKIDKKDK